MAITQQQIDDLNKEANGYMELANEVQNTIDGFNAQIQNYNAITASYQTQASYYNQDAQNLSAEINAVSAKVDASAVNLRQFADEKTWTILNTVSRELESFETSLNEKIEKSNLSIKQMIESEAMDILQKADQVMADSRSYTEGRMETLQKKANSQIEDFEKNCMTSWKRPRAR